jgi:large subunit ribosomal protein L21
VFAVITVGGHQYRVTEGERILVNRIVDPVGQTVRVEDVIAVGADGQRHVGLPRVEGAVVEAKVLEHLRGRKIEVFKYRPKKRFRSRTGFRAELTALRVASITWPGAPERKAEPTAEPKTGKERPAKAKAKRETKETPAIEATAEMAPPRPRAPVAKPPAEARATKKAPPKKKTTKE